MSRWSHAHPENPEGPQTHPLAHVEGQADAMRKGEISMPRHEHTREEVAAAFFNDTREVVTYDPMQPPPCPVCEVQGLALLAQNDAAYDQLERYKVHGPELLAACRIAADFAMRVGDGTNKQNTLAVVVYPMLRAIIAKVEGRE